MGCVTRRDVTGPSGKIHLHHSPPQAAVNTGASPPPTFYCFSLLSPPLPGIFYPFSNTFSQKHLQLCRCAQQRSAVTLLQSLAPTAGHGGTDPRETQQLCTNGHGEAVQISPRTAEVRGRAVSPLPLEAGQSSLCILGTGQKVLLHQQQGELAGPRETAGPALAD